MGELVGWQWVDAHGERFQLSSNYMHRVYLDMLRRIPEMQDSTDPMSLFAEGLNDSDIKLYRRHYCERTHGSWALYAKCIWRKAHWVSGEGPFATVSYCRGITVQLHGTAPQARQAKRVIDESMCGGACTKHHDIVRLFFPVTRGRSPYGK